MSRVFDTIMAFIYGFLGSSLVYLSYYGIMNLRFPPTWVSVSAVLFFSTIAVSLEPGISGNLIIDSLISGLLAYLATAILVNGLVAIRFNPPPFNNFFLLFLVQTLVIRGWLWAEEEVEFEI